ncbi:acetolactate synthase large subunit, partial [Pseudomonas sp. DCB_PUT]
MAKAADVVVQCLENEGVEYVFGIPGEENLDLLESLRKSKIKLVLTRHEQSAGFMAATYGRLTGKTGVSLSTLGPGATNLVTASAYAYLGGMPMMMITGQKPIKKSKQGRFQIIDVCGMMDPITKYTHQFASADNIPARMREAFRLAEEEKPGAVHLELPEDIAAEQTDALPIPRSLHRRPLAEHVAIEAAVEKLKTARNPILVIGAGANRKMTAKVLKQLIDKTGIPFITTQMGKGVVDERHPRFLGNAALSSGDFVHRAVEAADLIINIGHDVIEKPPFFMVRGGTEVIHINFRSAEVDAVYFPQVEVIGDIANAVWQISEALNDTSHWDFTRLMAIREANEAQIAEGADDNRFPVYPQRLVADIRR